MPYTLADRRVGSDQFNRRRREGRVGRRAARRHRRGRQPRVDREGPDGHTDGTGQFKIINLRPGIYTVTFTLTGFTTVRREGIELTSDFTANVNADLRVGAVAETITVTGETPVVDVQNITTRTVMTREVMDVMPTGRNIQAVGILIPGTQLALGGGGALSRDVGGSGGLQQSPLQYRGSPDTVQTIDGLRLNNLCANGAYSGVYWNDQSLQEFSYVTGADSAEMGQGGIRVNMVPKDGGNAFRGVAFGNYTPSSWASDNCGSGGVGLSCSRSNLTGDTTFNKTNNFLTNVSVLTKNYDSSLGLGGPIVRDRAWFYAAFRYLGVNKTVPDSFYNLNAQVPGRFTPYAADTSRPGVDDGHIRSVTGRVTLQVSERNKVTYYHDEQDKLRGHWGIASTVPPEASAIEPTPTNFVSVSKWTRTHTSKLLFEVGVGRLRPGICGDLSAGRLRGARPARDDPRQQHQQNLERVEQPGRPFLEAVHRVRGRLLRDRRALPARRHDRQPGAVAARSAVHRRRAAGHLQQRRARVRHAAHSNRPEELHRRGHGPLRPGSLDDQSCHDQRRAALRHVQDVHES